MRSKNISGLFSVLVALLGNIIVAVIKFAAAFISGSSAMFSEAIHSVADTANQSFLLIGIIKSQKKADDEFTYGYGKERFFWALISACGIFFIGAGVTIYHGITSLIEPHQIEYHPIVFFVLFISFVIESTTLYIAVRELKRRHKHKQSLMKIFQEGDPSTLAVVFEDGIAVLGVFIAGASIGLTIYTGNQLFDSLGSIVIGSLLGMVAILLIYKNKRYLIGHSIPEDIEEEIVELLEKDPAIEKVIDFKSMVLDVGIYRVKCEIEFNGNALLKELSQSYPLREAYEDVKGDYEEFKKFVADYADRVPRLVGKRIDEIEKQIEAKYPSIRHIDIELN
ncbi:cation diffusion facilitator family transporter [Candidatus Parcubacteria bacterium]|jgi:zinc transporter 9|nr:MAG: cation diffusion facilitator family transporter [Candidatus Parcubacteria bacterium]